MLYVNNFASLDEIVLLLKSNNLYVNIDTGAKIRFSLSGLVSQQCFLHTVRTNSSIWLFKIFHTATESLS